MTMMSERLAAGGWVIATPHDEMVIPSAVIEVVHYLPGGTRVSTNLATNITAARGLHSSDWVWPDGDPIVNHRSAVEEILRTQSEVLS